MFGFVSKHTNTRKYSSGKLQEAYRTRRNLSKCYQLSRGGTTFLVGGGGVPESWLGGGHWGTPLGRDLGPVTWVPPGNDLGPVTGVSPRKHMGQVVGIIMGWRWGTPPPPIQFGQTDACENNTLPSYYVRRC